MNFSDGKECVKGSMEVAKTMAMQEFSREYVEFLDGLSDRKDEGDPLLTDEGMLLLSKFTSKLDDLQCRCEQCRAEEVFNAMGNNADRVCKP